MRDIISIISIVIGIIFLVIGKKKHNLKVLKFVGILIILIALIVAAPDFIKGFKDGLAKGYNS